MGKSRRKREDSAAPRRPQGSSIDFVDLATSAAVAAASFIFSDLDLASLSAQGGESFSGVFARLVLAFFAMYAIGEASSYIYRAYLRRRTGPSPIAAADDVAAPFVMSVSGIILVGTFYAVYRNLVFPYVSVILTAINGFMLGLSIGAERSLEAGAFGPQGSGRARELFDHALKNNLPFGALALVVVFPVDWFIEGSAYPAVAKAILIGACLAGYLYLGSKLSDLPWTKVELKPRNNLATSLVVVALTCGSMLGYRYWDESAAEGIRQINGSPTLAIVMLVMSGLVPIRIVPLVFARRSLVNAVSNVASLALYMYLKIRQGA